MVKIALIPAGGRGIGLLPATRALPKELYPFGGKPVIEHVIQGVRECGISNIIFVAGYKKSALLDYIGDGSLFQIDASFVYQEKPTGPGDAILCGNMAIQKEYEDFLVCFGDNIVLPPSQIKDLINLHNKFKPLASVLVFPTTTPTRYGIVQIQPINSIARIIDIIEKPRNPEDQEKFRSASGQFLAMSSIMVFNVRIFDYLRRISPDQDDRYQIADALVKAIKEGEQVIAHRLTGQFIDVSSWDFLWSLRKYFRNLTDDQLSEIIEERNSLMKKIFKEDESKK
ncbi:MAG: nucleotidyltransferase family protein [Candidatus Hodarchaeales archaeon]